MTPVAVVGLGAMGSRIARRFLDDGYEVHVWNRSPDKAARLVQAGAVVASTPAEAAARARFVATMLADPAALAAVSEGTSGIAAGSRPGTTLLEMSTVGPVAVERLRSAMPAGVDVVDAPVLGSLSEAEAGTLRIFVGGTREAYERVRDLLTSLGSPLHAGPPGAGAAAKLVANSTLFGTLGVLGEAIALGDALGLERGVTFDVLDGTPIAAQAARRRESLERGDFPHRFALSLARKDAALVAAAAEAAGVDVRLAAAALTWLVDAEAAGLGQDDYARVLDHIVRGGRD